MPKNFHNRLKNIIKESLGDLSWIQNSESNFNPKFDFDGKEYWLDISMLNERDKEKIVDYIKKVLPKHRGFSDNFRTLNQTHKGIVIHCGSDETDYKPEENLICFIPEYYEDDYNDSQTGIPHIYVDGREVIEFINLTNDEEELDESLEWSDKDEPFDEKDKSFENDPSWKDDEDWELNPERSYWKQGDAGGSGGGDVNESNDLDWIKDVKADPLMASPDVFFRDDDEMYYTLGELGHDITNMEEFTMCELAINYGYRWSEDHEGWYHRDEVADFVNGNFPKGVRRGLDESDELQWIKDVPNTIPPYDRRITIDLKDFIFDIAKDDVDLLHFLTSEDFIGPTEKYMRTGNGGEGFTPEDWDDFGYDEWAGDGDWVDNHEWRQDPQIWQHEIRESMELTDGTWKMVEWDTTDYDLEHGTHRDRMVFKRKSDGAYFSIHFSGNHYDGIDDWNDELYQVFPRKITRLIYESKLIKRVIKEEVDEWRSKQRKKKIEEDIDIAYEDNNLIVIHPKTQEASCYYGNDTRWCTSAEGGEAFDEYNSSGNLYYYMWKFKMPPKLQNFQKIARLIGYGKEYGEIGEFFLFDDASMTPYDILFNILEGKNGDNGFTYPNKLKPLNESWERALIAVDTHYAKNGLHKAPSEYNNDDDYDEDDMGGFGGELLDY